MFRFAGRTFRNTGLPANERSAYNVDVTEVPLNSEIGADEVHAPGEMEVLPVEPPEAVRVGWIAAEDTIERLSRTLQPLAIGLLDELVEITTACPPRAIVSDLPSPPMEVVRYGRLRFYGFRTHAVEALAEELRPQQLELLHALDCRSAALTRQLAEMLNLRYVVSSYSLGDGRLLGTLDERVAGVLAASEPIRTDLLEHHVAAVEKIQLLHPGVYQVRHTTLFENPSQSVAIVAGGRLDDFTAFEAVLKCFAELKNRDYDCVFFVIGNGRAERQLRHLSERLDLSSVLTFVDRQQPSRMSGIFKAADIYLSPAPSRSIDISALLAMAAGDPVIAAGGGCSDFLLAGQTALLYRAGDWAELTAKVISLLDDHEAARRLANSALKHLHDHYSPASMVSCLAGMYRGVIAGAGAAAAR